MKPAGNDIPLTSIDALREALDALVWGDGPTPERFGIEVEAFPVVVKDGSPHGRLPLEGANGARAIAERVTAGAMCAGEKITFEPGGQIEFSSAPACDVGELVGRVDDVWGTLAMAFEEHDVVLVPIGADPWHPIEMVPQQLDAPRYRAMERYFEREWPAGAVMMRNTASLQVSVEAGHGAVRRERWLAANLLAPLMVAIFATSPSPAGVVSRRTRIWQDIDPSRTGLPFWSSSADADPIEDVLRRVLAARVMFVIRDGHLFDLSPATFEDWLLRPGDVGPPTIDDLSIHLSTIFPEVRPRHGTFELRSTDALPRRWWPAPLVFASALLYDEVARRQVIETLSGTACRLEQTLSIAAETGLRSPLLARPAEKLVRLAAETAGCDSRFTPEVLGRFDEFIDRFTLRGRAPSDEMRPLLGDPAALLTWTQI